MTCTFSVPLLHYSSQQKYCETVTGVINYVVVVDDSVVVVAAAAVVDSDANVLVAL